MNRKTISFAALFLIGAIFGGLCVELVDHSHENQALFANKLRCQSLGTKYEKENTSGPFITAIDRIDYSRARNSCIAETSETMLNPNSDPSLTIEVVDIMDDQKIFVAGCSETDQDCRTKAYEARDTAFGKALRKAN